MVFFSIKKRSVKTIASWLMFFTPEELELTTFVEKVFREEFGQDKRGPAAEED